MDLYDIIFWYALGAVVVNFIYDVTISRLGQLTEDDEVEKLRFNMAERFWVGLVWPIFFVTFIIKLIKLINGKN